MNFGFVEMSKYGEASKAMAALNASEFDGRSLNVKEAQPKAHRPRR